MAELRRHVAETFGNADAVLVLDPSGFPKKGTASCGVARQWCGRFGKIDNCQVGVSLAYVTSQGFAPLDQQLYLPRESAEDNERRQDTTFPQHVTFQESLQRIGLALLERSAGSVPFGWVAGDDELGRASALRAALRERGSHYVLDVPCNALVRELAEEPARDAGCRRGGGSRTGPGCSRHRVGDGWWSVSVARVRRRSVRALEAWVQTKEEDGRVGACERVVVIRTVAEESQVWYTLSSASVEVPLAVVVEAHSRRHGVEEVLQAGKGEVGLAHYEVRSWVGWHHHITLSLLALWFLILEKGRLGKKNPRVDGAADA